MRSARLISIVGHPFVTATVMAAGSAVRPGGPGGATRAALVVALLALLPIAVLMLVQVRRGAWQNVDASNVRERPALFAASAAGLALLLAYSLAVHPQAFLIRGAIGTLAMVMACALATRWLKVSLHVAFAALAATTLLLLGSGIGWLVAAAVPVLAWSRLKLARHRPLEVALGLLAGVLAGLGIYAA